MPARTICELNAPASPRSPVTNSSDIDSGSECDRENPIIPSPSAVFAATITPPSPSTDRRDAR